jgi:16S rRNA (guanine527-N7)-methyltransferase
MPDAGARSTPPLEVGPVEPLTPPASFVERARELGIAFDEGDLDRLGLHLALVLHVNERFNLTAIRDPEEAWERHVLDSLTLLPVLEEIETGEGGRLEAVDVGSGAGYPGIPLAIARPDARVVLLEATGKKAEFLRLCAARLGLSNVEVANERAEGAGAHGAGRHRGRYHAVVTRAVGRVAVAAELCVPLARVGGLVVMVKGEKAAEELAEGAEALRLLRAEHAGTIETPTGRLVVLQKVAPTPREYPRRDGEPKRSPLGTKA